MRSDKARTNAKWTSNKDYRSKWDEIFGKGKQADEEKPTEETQVPADDSRKEVQEQSE